MASFAAACFNRTTSISPLHFKAPSPSSPSLVNLSQPCFTQLPSATYAPISPPPRATFKITFITQDGTKVEIEAPDDVYILDSADSAGLDLPYSCRAGACSTCAGRILQGSVDQEEGSFLEDEQKDMGFVLTCIAYPTSNLVIKTHAEEDIG